MNPTAPITHPIVLKRTRRSLALIMMAAFVIASNGADADMTEKQHADVISVQASGAAGAYQFDVGIQSPDRGCRQYADWWEVVSDDGKLLYRRVLLHSHVNEQPFVRSGGPVPIKPDTVVWVRAHMNKAGYGGVVLKGSVQSGFARAQPAPEFAAGLVRQPPLPDDCAF